MTDAGSPQLVPPAARIAVFDNDGTLWSEQPMYFQGSFALDRVRALAKHPEWKPRQPFKGILEVGMWPKARGTPAWRSTRPADCRRDGWCRGQV